MSRLRLGYTLGKEFRAAIIALPVWNVSPANGHLEIANMLLDKEVVRTNNPTNDWQRHRGDGVAYYWFAPHVAQDVNIANEDGNTALHWACLNGHVEVCYSLGTALRRVS
eukprot:7137401-Pyramimonas_sp.AAC.2